MLVQSSVKHIYIFDLQLVGYIKLKKSFLILFYSIGFHQERNQVVVYGGGTHLSKEYLIGPNGEKICGYVVSYNKDGTWNYIPDAIVTTLSQEHGIITFNDKEGLSKFKTGDIIGKTSFPFQVIHHFFCLRYASCS